MRTCKKGRGLTEGNTGSGGRCKTCGKNRAQAKRDRTKASFIGPVFPKHFCLRGHDKKVTGATKGGACKKCEDLRNEGLRKARKQEHRNFVGPKHPYGFCRAGHEMCPSNTYRKMCKTCRSERAKKRYSINREHILGTNAVWRESNRDRMRELSGKWRRDNPSRWNSLIRAAQAAKIKRTPPWLTAADFRFMEGMYAAARALGEETGRDYHVDHIVPLRGKTLAACMCPGIYKSLQLNRIEQKAINLLTYSQRPDNMGAYELSIH